MQEMLKGKTSKRTDDAKLTKARKNDGKTSEKKKRCGDAMNGTNEKNAMLRNLTNHLHTTWWKGEYTHQVEGDK